MVGKQASPEWRTRKLLVCDKDELGPQPVGGGKNGRRVNEEKRSPERYLGEEDKP